MKPETFDRLAFAESQRDFYLTQAEQAAAGSVQRERWQAVAQKWQEEAARLRAERNTAEEGG